MKGGHNKKSVRVEFVMSEPEAELVKRTHGGTWHYQPVGISDERSAVDGYIIHLDSGRYSGNDPASPLFVPIT